MAQYDTSILKQDLFKPEVLAPILENSYQQNMALMPLADIDRTLVGNPSDEITVPIWGHIGEAVDLAEGQEIPVDKLGQGYTKATVAKFGKGVEFSDEANIERLGDIVSQSTKQIGQVIAQRADSKLLESALAVENKLDVTFDIDGIDQIVTYFATDVSSPAYTLIMHPKTRLAINKAVREYLKGSDVGAQIVLNGAVPSVLGTSLYATTKMPEDKILAVLSTDQDIAYAKELEDKIKAGHLTDQEIKKLNTGRPFKWYVKRDLMVEYDRNKATQMNQIYGTVIGAPYVQNPSKVLVASLKKA